MEQEYPTAIEFPQVTYCHSLRPVLNVDDMLPFLRTARLKWPRDESQRPLEMPRQLLQDSGEVGSHDLNELLERMSNPDSLDWAMEEAFKTHGTRLMSTELGHRLTICYHALCGKPTAFCLPLFVGTKIYSITIPNTSRDDMVIDMNIACGAKAEALVRFMITQRLVNPEERLSLLNRWKESDAVIGHEQHEAEYLDKCLSVTLDNTISENVSSVRYNYGMESGNVWRECRTQVTVHAPLDLSRFPFDSTKVVLQFRGKTDFDASERIIMPDSDSPRGSDLLAATPPRGCRIEHITESMEPIVESVGRDEMPESAIRFAFQLSRISNTLVWRTFIPAFVILLLGLTATIGHVVFGVTNNSAMTQIMSVLIACVALQLTAAQFVPPHSGRTTLDSVFVLIYVQVLALYLALQFYSPHRPVSRQYALAIVLVATLLFLAVTANVAIKTLKARRHRRR